MTDVPCGFGVRLDGVSKWYRAGDGPALDDVTLDISGGEFVAVMGPSGSGKTTLLNLVAGTDAPTGGRITVGGRDLTVLGDDERSDLRLRHVGIIFQSRNLLATLTVEENVAWPAVMLGVSWSAARQRARDLLARVGLDEAAARRLPATLSGGEQQRVAVARAMVVGPGLLLADEPTGSLDRASARTVLGLLAELNAERGVTVILVSHDLRAARHAGRTIELRHGRLVTGVRAVGAARRHRWVASGNGASR